MLPGEPSATAMKIGDMDLVEADEASPPWARQ